MRASAPARSMQLLRARQLLRHAPPAMRAASRPPPAAALPRGAHASSTSAQAAGSAPATLDGRFDYADVAVPRAVEVLDGVWRDADARLVRHPGCSVRFVGRKGLLAHAAHFTPFNARRLRLPLLMARLCATHRRLLLPPRRARLSRLRCSA